MVRHTRLLLVAASAWMVSLLAGVSGAQAPVPAVPSAGPHQVADLFAHSNECMTCHNNLTAPSGADVSIGTTWRSTMMANSARDPYWHASVRRETLDHPAKADAIQDECAACHMPIATRLAHAAGTTGAVFAHLGGTTAVDELASDGISCSVCHQISDDGLGSSESFNGQFTMRPARPDGVREIFGPFAVDAGRRTVMRSSSGGFEQVEAPHIRQSELCATCHTLITEALGPDGSVIGRLPEQMNYQEWQHSAFAAEGQTCQSCHMPRVEGPVRVASVLGEERDGLSQHTFVGGNAFMVRMLNRFRTDLGIEASPAEMEATARATERQLREDTATLTIANVNRTASRLAFDVDVRNLAGHKFPTGYPARRAWLQVVVRDGRGQVLFESGGLRPDGSIVGNDGDADAGRFEPHYDRISDAAEVQIYEAILGGSDGVPTTGLLSAVRYLKDNRLLPRGFDKATAGPDIGVYGAASTDSTFTEAGDRVRYDISVPSAAGPLTVDVSLRYQPIAYRWANNLAAYDAPEPVRFLGFFRAMADSSSSLVASATTALTN